MARDERVQQQERGGQVGWQRACTAAAATAATELTLLVGLLEQFKLLRDAQAHCLGHGALPRAQAAAASAASAATIAASACGSASATHI